MYLYSRIDNHEMKFSDSLEFGITKFCKGFESISLIQASLNCEIQCLTRVFNFV